MRKNDIDTKGMKEWKNSIEYNGQVEGIEKKYWRKGCRRTYERDNEETK
jgi:hypothetical protein